jgi:hypothetical protein
MTQDPHEERERSEEDAAGAEAANIGGQVPDAGDVPPEERAVREGGGGEQEGFEIAEDDLVESASHGDPAPPPDQLSSEEVESDRSTAEYGEGDEEDSTAVVRDPGAGPDDPGEGPGLTTER